MSQSVRRGVPRSRGPGRAIVVTLVVVALLVVAADVVLRLVAERWLEGRVQDTLALESRPDLDIGGFPFLTQFARGEYERVEATFEELSFGGVRLDEVAVVLRNLEFNQSDVLTGSAGTVRIRRGRGSVEIREPSFNGFLRDQGVPVTVEFREDEVVATTRVQAGGQEATASASGPIRLDGRTLVFEPGEVEVDGAFGVPPAALSFSVELPPLFRGVRYERVRVEEALLALDADFTDTALELED